MKIIIFWLKYTKETFVIRQTLIVVIVSNCYIYYKKTSQGMVFVLNSWLTACY